MIPGHDLRVAWGRRAVAGPFAGVVMALLLRGGAGRRLVCWCRGGTRGRGAVVHVVMRFRCGLVGLGLDGVLVLAGLLRVARVVDEDVDAAVLGVAALAVAVVVGLRVGVLRDDVPRVEEAGNLYGLR